MKSSWNLHHDGYMSTWVENNVVNEVRAATGNSSNGQSQERILNNETMSIDDDDDYDESQGIPPPNKPLIENTTRARYYDDDNDDDTNRPATPRKIVPNTARTDRLNIIILYPDDWRHDSIGSLKSHVHTPFLTSLSQRSVRFAYNCVTTSICWMSRASFFMGQFASRHESYRLVCPHFARDANRWKWSWPALLRKADYFVGHVGKWQYFNDVKGDKLFDWDDVFEGQHWWGEMTASEKAKNSAIEFLNDRPKDKNFALTVAFYPPKPVGNGQDPGAQFKPDGQSRSFYDNVTINDVPYNMTEAYDALPKFLQSEKTAAKERWNERYRTPQHYQESMRNYYALITQVDKACGEIWEEVVAQQLENQTMIIFTTDNGMFHGAHGLAGKWYPYQESIRVPLIVYDPRMPKEKRGTVDDSFTLNIDLAETILSAAGVESPAIMQGRDISDLYIRNDGNENRSLDENPWREEFFYEFPYHDISFIPPSTALIQKKWKYIRWPKHGYEQLFNLEDDPLELHDLYGEPETADILKELRKRHDDQKHEVVRPNATNKEECVGQSTKDLLTRRV